MKDQQSLLNPEDVDRAQEIDRQHAERTAKAVAAKREWFIERISDDGEADVFAACANRLDAISNTEAGLIHDVKPMPDGSFVIIWWGWN